MDKIVNNKIRLEFVGKGENVAIARITIAALVSQLSLTLNDLEEIKVAVSEAVSNAIIHGYQNNSEGIVTVTGEIAQEVVMIQIIDQGIGIPDIDKAMEPEYSTDPERMGLGFIFMKSFMDEVRVESKVGCGTTVSLIKRISMNMENAIVS